MSAAPRNPISLVEREIETKIEAAVRAEIKEGRKRPADMGRRDHEAIARRAEKTMSPEAWRHAAHAGLGHMVECVFGEMLADRLWETGLGYGVSADEVVRLARELRFYPPEDAPAWLEKFREDMGQSTRRRLEDCYRCAERWRPLFVGEDEYAFLGEIAIKKALAGSALAKSFLSGRPS